LAETDPAPAAELDEQSHEEPAVVTRDAILSPLDRMMSALRHQDAHLNREAWSRAVDELESWAKHVEERLARL
jgi:hypothetical protein